MTELPPKGQRMLETRGQFERMAELYEKALLEREEEISRLRCKVNKLEQKLGRKRG